MDRADIVPVSLHHPDPSYEVRTPGIRNIALSVAFSCVSLEAPAYTVAQTLMHVNRHCRELHMTGVLGASPTACGMFFELASIEQVYVNLEIAARRAGVSVVWHEPLTEQDFWQMLPHQPQLRVLQPLVLQQPV